MSKIAELKNIVEQLQTVIRGLESQDPVPKKTILVDGIFRDNTKFADLFEESINIKTEGNKFVELFIIGFNTDKFLRVGSNNYYYTVRFLVQVKPLAIPEKYNDLVQHFKKLLEWNNADSVNVLKGISNRVPEEFMELIWNLRSIDQTKDDLVIKSLLEHIGDPATKEFIFKKIRTLVHPMITEMFIDIPVDVVKESTTTIDTIKLNDPADNVLTFNVNPIKFDDKCLASKLYR